jgi:hypothetical protein
MEDYFEFEIVRTVLIPMFYKEAQLGRSLRANNIAFKKQVVTSCIELANKADKGTLKNEDIRKEIKIISTNTKATIGQTQKIINVYLKYYCILTKKPLELIKELDCPLDSQSMKANIYAGLTIYKLKNFNNFDEYVNWQNHLESKGNGIRLSPDIEAYDKKRIEKFFTTDKEA